MSVNVATGAGTLFPFTLIWRRLRKAFISSSLVKLLPLLELLVDEEDEEGTDDLCLVVLWVEEDEETTSSPS